MIENYQTDAPYRFIYRSFNLRPMVGEAKGMPTQKIEYDECEISNT